MAKDREALDAARRGWAERVARVPAPRRRARHAIEQLRAAERDLRRVRALAAWDLYEQLGSWAKAGRAMRDPEHPKGISGTRARALAREFAPERAPAVTDRAADEREGVA